MSPPTGGSPYGDLVVVSNRGPTQLQRSPGGAVVAGRALGGLASTLTVLLAGSGATWICAAMGAGEREIVASGAELPHDNGVRLVMVAPDEADYSMAYEVVSNSVLWFVYHDLFDKVRRPVLDDRWATAWAAYRNVNRVFAEEAADRAGHGATVLVQDYQLHLVGSLLKELRPDLKIVHFVHTPFCEPGGLRLLPDTTAAELISAMAAYDACGFHTQRWRHAFTACCEAVGVEPPFTFAKPLGIDEPSLTRSLATPEVGAERARILRAVGDRHLVVRVDRMEPSKNLLRGFLAFERMLENRPGLRGAVTFLALTYPSRESLAEYRTYRAEVETTAQRINDRWSPPRSFASGGSGGSGGSEATGVCNLASAESDPETWHPIILEVEDDYPRSLAAMSLYDVLLVNPVRDGLNLVAKEGPLVNDRNGTVILSREAGVWDELSDVAVGVNPFDVGATAEAMASALPPAGTERAGVAKRLREAARRSRLDDWLTAQTYAAETATSDRDLDRR